MTDLVRKKLNDRNQMLQQFCESPPSRHQKRPQTAAQAAPDLLKDKDADDVSVLVVLVGQRLVLDQLLAQVNQLDVLFGRRLLLYPLHKYFDLLVDSYFDDDIGAAIAQSGSDRDFLGTATAFLIRRVMYPGTIVIATGLGSVFFDIVPTRRVDYCNLIGGEITGISHDPARYFVACALVVVYSALTTPRLGSSDTVTLDPPSRCRQSSTVKHGLRGVRVTGSYMIAYELQDRPDLWIARDAGFEEHGAFPLELRPSPGPERSFRGAFGDGRNGSYGLVQSGRGAAS